MGRQNGAAILEDSWAVSYKTKYSLPMPSRNCTLDIHSIELKAYAHIRNLCTTIYGIFIQHHHTMEATRMSLSKQMGKQAAVAATPPGIIQ